MKFSKNLQWLCSNIVWIRSMFFSNILQVTYDFVRTSPSKGHKGQSECEFEYEHFTLAFSSHSNPHSLCFFGCEGRKYPHTQTQTHSVFFGCEGGKYPHTQTQTHTVFLGVKEENILTLKPKLTLFFWVWSRKISSPSNSNSRCFFGCEGGKYPHTQTQTHSVFLSLEDQNILTLKPKLTLFFLGCEGRKYPHPQTQTYAVFLWVWVRTLLLWPFLHTQTQTHTLKTRMSLFTRVYSSFGGRVVVRHIFLKRTIKLAIVFK